MEAGRTVRCRSLGAALPQLRTDLGLSYGQVGALFAIPAVVGNLIEVPFALLADRGHRRRLVVGGGVAFAAALAAMAAAPSYAVLLVAVVVYYPASGAFVGVSQAIVVDTDPARGEALMALLHLSDLLGDVLTSFLALYLVDVAGLGAGGAALGLAVWAGAGLVGDAVAVPVLDRLDGRVVVRVAGVVPLTLGLVAEHLGLAPMVWLLLVGPLALVVGLRR